MRHNFLILICGVTILSAPLPALSQSGNHAPLIVAKPAEIQEAEVKEIVLNFQTALLQGDGAMIPPMVTKSSLEFYSRMRRLALESPESSTRQLPLAEKSIVLKMRRSASAEELKKWSPGDLLAQGLTRGWLLEEPSGYVQPGKVEFGTNEAHAAALENDRPLAPEYALHFMREGSEWKLDLAPLRARSASILEAAVMHEGRSADDYLIRAMEKEAGEKVNPRIWQGPIR